MNTKALKYSRLVIAAIAASLLTILIALPGPFAVKWFSWVAKLQFLPLALSFSLGWFVFWIMLTLCFGRLYCSTICPMGALQDIFAHIGHRKRHYHYRHPVNRIRYAILAAVVCAIVAGIPLLATLLDPYSAFSRIVVNFARPAAASLLGFVIALITLVAVAIASWRRGRIVCNTVCPVGSTLAVISRYSIFHIDIDTDLCIQCRKCEHVCKSECIDLIDHVVDCSRCVDCFNCVSVCPTKAIRFTPNRKQLSIPMMQRIGRETAQPSATNSMESSTPVRLDRRAFLATGAIIAATVATKPLKAAANRAGLKTDDPAAKPVNYPTPPGTPSRADFLDRCTGCELCVAECPSGVLRQSVNQYGLLYALHPYRDFDKAVCRLRCTRCTQVCPTGALLPLTVNEKLSQPSALARPVPAYCIHCGQCASACPVSAIDMRPSPSGAIPVVDPSRCVGCGACQHICPAPTKAIIVDGI